MKALLSARNLKHKRTHNLQELITQLTNAGEVLPVAPFRLLRLQDFAVELRYDTGDPLSDEERKQFLVVCEVLQAHTIKRILALQAEEAG